MNNNAYNNASVKHGSHVPVEPGFWIAIFMDLVAFSALFVTILYRRYESASNFQEFAEGAKHLNQGIGFANTLILMTSSFFVARAVVLYRGMEVKKARNQLIVGILLGVSFIALKSVEYSQKLNEGITIESGVFYGLYFAATGIHLFHVFVGVLFLIFISRNYGLDKQEGEGLGFAWVEAAGCYWHMVDLLWFLLFALLYLVPQA
jgi:nitric oxide reductase NorE protein